MALLNAQQAAELLGVTAEWVRGHASELGAIRLGDGPKAPYRFDPAQIDSYLERRRLPAPATPAARRRPGPRRQTAAGFELLPLPGGPR